MTWTRKAWLNWAAGLGPAKSWHPLTQSLFDKYQIALLGFDVVFAEPDDSSGLKQLQSLAQKELSQDAGFVTHLAQLTPTLDDDRLLAQSLVNRPVVIGYYFSSDQGGRTSGELP